MRFLRYLAWNCFLIGTLSSGYFLGASNFAGIVIGIVYSLIVPILFIGAIFQKQLFESGDKSLEENIKLRIYHILEIVFISATFYMGYTKIGIAMIMELCLILYIAISFKQYSKESK